MRSDITLSSTEDEPIPVAVTLRNLFPPSVKRSAGGGIDKFTGFGLLSLKASSLDSTDSANDGVSDRDSRTIFASSTRRVAHAVNNVFVPVTLQIVVPSSVLSPLQQNENLSKSGVGIQEDENGEVILFSILHNNISSHPLWDHLNERLDDWYGMLLRRPLEEEREETLTDGKKVWQTIYKAMKVRIKLVDKDEQCQQETQESLTLAEAPLHPKKLFHLPQNPLDETRSSRVIGKSKYASDVPQSLPPNSILIHFADGVTRVLPSLYDLLLQKSVIRERTGSVQTLQEDTEEKKYAKRFDDDIFDVLSDETSTDKIDSSSNFLGSSQSIVPSIQSTTAQTSVTMSNIILSSSSTEENLNVSGNKPCDVLQHSVEAMIGDSNVVNCGVDGEETGLTDSRAREEIMNGLNQEIEQLQSILNTEKNSLEDDEISLRSSLDTLNTITLQIMEIEKERDEINIEISSEIQKCMEVGFLLEARQTKLLKGLKSIYPIQPLTGGIYSIVGLKLPHDMYSLDVSDEIISAGLGYVCHLVFVTSKYLSNPLRYRMICNCSRSVIQDDNNNIFPLFREKVYDRAQFDRAILLLNRNIDLLLRMRGINAMQSNERPHILAKLNVFFKKMVEIDGEDNTSNDL